MNERTKIKVDRKALPRWWCLTDKAEDESVEVVDSLSILSGRLSALGDMLLCSTSLDDSTISDVGDLLRETADGIEALAGALGERNRARKRAAVEPEPDALEGLRRQQAQCGSMADRLREIHRDTMRKCHAAVITEIEAGTRDESDREEADRLLAEALAD